VGISVASDPHSQHRPLTDLLRKHTFFVWTADHTTAFEALKQALTSAPVLALPNFSKTFIVEIDDSDEGIGAVLMQEGRPLAFLSNSLSTKSKGLSSYEKEYIAILLAVQHWLPYLQQAEFHIYTHHKSLSQLNQQRLHTVWQHKVFTKLLGLQYKIIYRKGYENKAVDALSRKVPLPGVMHAISSPVSQWLLSVQSSYDQDMVVKEIIFMLVLDSAVVPHCTFKDGLLGYKTRIWVGSVPELQNQLIAALHSSTLDGYFGFRVTNRRLKSLFYWKGMKDDVHQFVKCCQVRLQASPATQVNFNPFLFLLKHGR
jgi:hypothetical protein